MKANKSGLMLPLLSIPIITASLHGATIVQSQNFSVAQDTFDFVFNKFDTTLGTLTGAAITLNYTRSDGYVTADNEGASAATISFTHTTRQSGQMQVKENQPVAVFQAHEKLFG